MKTTAIAKQSIFGLVALDQIPQLADQLDLSLEDPADKQLLDELSRQIMKILSPESTGVIVSPEYSFHTIIHKDDEAGLVLSLEQRQSDRDPLQIPQLAEDWGPESVKHNYGVCKLELYYHPKEDYALKKKQLVAEVHDYCQYLGIDFVLDLHVYPQGKSPSTEQLQQTKLWALEEFRTLCDLIIFELPQDPLTIVTVTAELDIPWLLRMSRVNYDTYKESLRTAVESGAAGFVIGHSLWAELPEPKIKTNNNSDGEAEQSDQAGQEQQAQYDISDTLNFIRTTARDRLIELRRIAAEANQIKAGQVDEASQAEANQDNNKNTPATAK